jgi:hypothetical protein
MATIATAPALSSHDFDKDLFLYTFSFNHSLVFVLTQKDGKGSELCISFRA